MANTLKLGDGNWAAKEGSLLAYNDENGNFKPLPFDFTRASSATRVNSQGLIEVVGSDQPRVDYSIGEGALLLEPSRSNLNTYSEDFNNAVWNTFRTYNVNITNTNTINPKGEQGSYKIASTNADNQFGSIFTILSGQSYSNSIYVKRVLGTGDIILKNVNNIDVNFQVNVSDGWKRIHTTVTSDSTNGRFYLSLANSGDEIEVWGAQLEQGSYATSYIPTSGAAVTRVGEDCKQTLPDNIIGQTEGTIYAEFNYLNSVGERRWIYQAGNNNNQVYARIEADQKITCQIVSNSTAYLTVQNLSTNIGVNKIAISYASNDAVIYINGSQVSSITSLVVPVINNVSVGVNIIQGQHLSGNINDFKTYDTRLSNEQLAALTTI